MASTSLLVKIFIHGTAAFFFSPLIASAVPVAVSPRPEAIIASSSLLTQGWSSGASLATTYQTAAASVPTKAQNQIFFQAEDGIRDIGVTGVQTCALPI